MRRSVCLRLGGAVTSAVIACAPAGEECDRSLRICDITDADCQAHVFAQTACARESEYVEVPLVRSITRAEFEEFLRDDEESTQQEQRLDAQFATALRMLGLLAPGTTSSDEAAIEAYARNVLAFYTRSDASVTIVETNVGDADDETGVFVLSHEFVHAQQDVDVGLEQFFAAYSTSTDSNIAVRSVSEGEAVLYANLTLARRPGARVDPDGFDEYYEEQQAALRAAAPDPSAADFTVLTSSFPYPFGGQLATHRWFAGGPADVLALYDDPPRSTTAVLRTLAHDDGMNTVDLPPLSAPPLPDGWTVIDEDTFGGWIAFAVARRGGLAEADADALARAWRGDRAMILGGPTTAEVALAWVLRFADDGAAERFAAIDLVPPPEGARSIRRTGRDVTLVLAVDATALAQWEDSFAAFVRPGPSLRAESSPTPARMRDIDPLPVHRGHDARRDRNR